MDDYYRFISSLAYCEINSYSASMETFLGNIRAECFLMGREYCEMGGGQKMVKIKK